MNRVPGSTTFCIVLLLIAAIPAFAVIPRFWETRAYGEWREGDFDGVSVTGDGELVLSPQFGMVYDTGAPLVFSAASDSEGSVYLGTGHEGLVFRVEAGGAATLLADFGELDVLALGVGPGGEVYAATSPNGRVYRVGPAGQEEVFFDPEDRYIWDIQFDSEGRMLVATGEDGVIYRVGTDGEAEVFYDSEDTHVLSMVVGPGDGLIAGGAPGGYVYRITSPGRAFVLYDSGMREVRDLTASSDGRIFAGVLNPANSGESGEGTQDAGEGGLRSRILEILPTGAVRSVWQSDSEMVFSLLHFEGRLYFSTGDRGRVYALREGLRQPDLLVESTEEQTTRLFLAGDRFLATSSNRGRLWELGDGERTRGVYESMVRDTGAISTWGKLAWTGRSVTLSTRTGNTSQPDATWSDWIEPGSSGDIMSPPARFIQWQATLDASAGGEPSLSSVTLPYLQQNFRPELSSLDVLEPGLALRDPQSNGNPTAVERSGVSGRRIEPTPRLDPRVELEAGSQALRWSASDRNEDVLSYEVFYRAENEDDWKLLAAGLSDTFYTIEPDTLPDGMYAMRVVVSDIGSNPAEDALTAEFVTRPFAIDSTPPTVSVSAASLDGSSVMVEAAASDQTSTLKLAGMSVDGGRWVPVFPVDGIVDSLSEEFRFASGPLAPGEHVISFRIYDQVENVGIGKTIVRIP